MYDMLWPVLLIVASNTLYQICAKGVPAEIHPLASVSVTYVVGAVLSIALYFMLGKSPNLAREYTHVNWAPLVLGIAIVGLELGNIYSYKAGWTISTLSIMQGGILAVVLVFVGALVYHEQITVTKLLGIACSLMGLYLINR
jgi:drug/metabolite transporter (DMT)-like permease